MEKWVIDRRVAVMEADGIEFVTSTPVGNELSWGELRQRYDAVLIAIGAGKPRDLQVEGRGLDGVHFAMDYLTQQNRVVAEDELDEARIDAAGKKVVILGGGDTGSDCLGTALRQGAEVVHQIELMPRPPDERSSDNPWPQWPMIYRVSTSQAEGGDRDFAVLTKKLTGEGGKLTHLHAVRIEVASKPGGGLSFVEQPDTEFTIEVDLVLLAMGFLGPVAEQLVDQLGVDLDARGNVATTNYASSVDGVFAAGDANRGQSLIVWAIAEGREAARAIDSYLRAGAEPWLPTRGRDYYFGGR
jgi:glutamate synthase (NADPH/NADH) small chain